MLDRLRTYASFDRVSHSVFALPFTLVGALLATRVVPWQWSRVLWTVAGRATARSGATGFERLAAAAYVARDPRTAGPDAPARSRGLRRRLLAGVCVLRVGARPALFRVVAGRVGDCVLVFAGEALHDLCAGVPGSRNGGGARRGMACGGWARGVGTL